MPYNEKFENYLRGRAHGMKARSPELAKISPQEAGSMLAEAEGQEKSAIAKAAHRLKRRKAR